MSKTPQLSFQPKGAKFYLYPSHRQSEVEGARVFEIDPGDFAAADIFNARSAEFDWHPIDDEDFDEYRRKILFGLYIHKSVRLTAEAFGTAGYIATGACDGDDIENLIQSMRHLQKVGAAKDV